MDSADDAILQYAEIVGGLPGEYLDVLYPVGQRNLLDAAHVSYEILVDDFDTVSSVNVEQYHTFEEMEAILEDVAESYPAITSLESIGKTYENHDIWCLEISDNPGVDEQEPGVFFMGLHHAREWPTLEICLQLIETLTTSYGVDPVLSDLVDNRRIWIVPCVNPDGFIYDHDENAGTKWWRKNRNYSEEFGTYGVDLNRNYGGSCNGDPLGMWGSVGMSHYSTSEVYCGTNPFSESEAESIKNLFLTEDICAAISWHTYSELVMWPWGYTKGVTTPDDNYMAEVGREIALRITTQDGKDTYTPTQSAGLYPTAGDTTDWAYGYYHYVLGKPLFVYTIEACSSFHPDEAVLDQVCKENIDGAVYLLQEAENISKTVVPRVLPPVISPVAIEPDGSFTVSWNQKNPKAHATRYQLEELSNQFLYTDSCEIDECVWIFDGFAKTDEKSFSGTMSYTSGRRNNAVATMTLQDPLYVESGMNLSFQCFYDIEENYDMAFVEVSTDGRCYDILDTFTGTSSEWSLKTYSLEKYVGQSLFIRFRYSTDSQVIGQGFFVDDIFPVSDFRTIILLSDTISTESFKITSRPDGVYYYRVRGYNEEHGWGDYSMLTRVTVDLTENQPPDAPHISGIKKGKIGEPYEYLFTGSDGDGDAIFFYISWGDGTVEEWIGPYEVDEQVTVEHVWSEKGDYVIKVRAKDSHQCMGEWTTLPVTMPKQSSILKEFFPLFLYRFFSSFSFL